MRRVLADPLVHFLLAGAVLFFVGTHFAADDDDARVRVPVTRVVSMVDAFESREGRAPSDEEVERIIKLIADSEILRREARRLGFDESDPIIQRRLGQKMRFVLEEEVEDGTFSDEDLQAHLEANAERYRRPAQLSFVHVFVAGDDLDEAGFAELGASLRAGGDPKTMGDPFNLGRSFRQRERGELARQLGREFADALFELAPGEWTSLESRFGRHWVRVDERIEARPARLDEVRAQVLESLRLREREAAVLRGVEGLRKRYVIDAPSAAEVRAARAEGA